jgi:predicted enzyme related to lactoylglutathione lyase
MADSTGVITKMEWWEIPVPDLDEARRFYGEVMGWGFSSATASGSRSRPTTSKRPWIASRPRGERS